MPHFPDISPAHTQSEGDHGDALITDGVGEGSCVGTSKVVRNGGGNRVKLPLVSSVYSVNGD